MQVFKSYFSKKNNKNDIMKALNYAAIAHRNQRRKDSEKTPYINHPIEVSYLLTSCGIKDTNIIIAAILHDIIEDTDVQETELRSVFGHKIINIVLECSDNKFHDKIMKKQKQIKHADKLSDEAKLVKLADKYSNICGLTRNPPKTWSKEEIDGYIIWVYAICNKLYGVNKNVDDKLKDFFKTEYLIGDLNDIELQKKLNDYYMCIDNSD